MPVRDFTSQRLYVTERIRPGAVIELDRAQSHYLGSVLRMGAGEEILVFNGVDGEWRARLAVESRKSASLEPLTQVKPQPASSDLLYLFAPLKQARQDYLVQKAVEMGVGALQPVLTERTQISRVNEERLRANVIEAAEQCGVLALPALRPLIALATALAALDPAQWIVFCDEDAPVADPIHALEQHRAAATSPALLIGPEGGFSPAERSLLLARPNVVRLSLGPRVLRADTAAVAALAILQASLGDWR